MTEVEGKMKLPVVDRGYDIAATDAYISMLQEEYNKIYAWGSGLKSVPKLLRAKRLRAKR